VPKLLTASDRIRQVADELDKFGSDRSVRQAAILRTMAATLDAQLRITERALDRLSLCSDHRDKATGHCVVCQAEERTRAEIRAERTLAEDLAKMEE